MVYHPRMSREDPQMKIRLPADLKDQIEAASKQSGRSMNAEIVVRLQGSFSDALTTSPPAMTTAPGAFPVNIDKLLRDLPVDLSSQYALHLYRSEQKIARAQLDEAIEESQQLYDKLQGLLVKEDSSPGSKMRAKEAVQEVNVRISELQNQLEKLSQTISAIHYYRKTSGLPEIRNVREVSASVKIG